jgi:indole-3-glycerol phosphate synthase
MILDTLAAAAKQRVAALEQQKSLAVVRQEAEMLNQQALAAGQPDLGRRFYQRLARPGLNFICEVKKASPSKGVIAQEFPYLQLAQAYERAGAAAISCLTEPEYFLGKDQYLQEIARTVKLPVLRKDFTVSAYQIYQARLLGAAAVLLIVTLLSEAQLREYLQLAASLHLAALVEAHTAAEVITALRAGARIIGVNNRNLQDFTVDLETSIRLRPLVPAGKLFVAESGIRTAADVKQLRQAGVNAVLIGETLMRSQDIAGKLRELAGNTGAAVAES